MIRSAIKYKQIVFYILCVIFIGGIYSFIVLPKQEAPDLVAPVARIIAVYPGASQEEVERFVTSKIEEQLMNMDEYDYSFSYSYNSVSTIIVFMKYGIDSEKTWNNLRRDLGVLQGDLPSEVLPLDINTDLVETAGMIISLTGDTYDYDELSFFGRSISEELKAVEGVTKFEIIGEVGKEVSVTINAQEMNRLGLSYEELARLIQAQNLEIPSGTVKTDDGNIPLRIKGSFTSIQEIENIILDVSTDNYSVLKLKDIASVEFEEEEASRIFLRDGKKAILLIGYFENNKNILDVGKDVRQAIKDIQVDLPEELNFEEVIFQPAEIDRSIIGFLYNLLIGIGLVIVVVFFGMGLRNAIVVSFAIPTSILATLLLMPVFDIKIHSISITAFIVALGMLVDNAIVVSDAIQNKIDEGIERIDACVLGTKEVIISILTSTLTTIAAFSPLILLSSIAGDYIKSLPQIVIISLSASFVFAFLVTPCLAFVFFKPTQIKAKKQSKTVMQVLLEFGIRHKIVSFVLGIVVLGLLGSTFLFLNIIFFPKTDKTIMYIDIKAEKNIDTDYTKGVTDQIEALLAKEPGIPHYTTAIGGAFPKYYDTLGVYAEIPENAQILMEIDLEKTDYVKNTQYAKYLQKKIDEILLGGKATVKELEYAEPISSPIYIRISGQDPDSLWEAASELEEVLNNVPGSLNVRTDYDPFVYEYEVVLDQRVLSNYGLMKYDVLNEVSIALRGRAVSVYRNQGEEYTLSLKSDLRSTQEIGNLRIKSSATGNKHLLKDLGDIQLVKIKPTIRKYNGVNTIILMSDVDKGFDSRTVEKVFKERIEARDFANTKITYDGESQKILVYFGNLGFSAAFATIMIFTIIFIQFKNFRQSFIILLSLPLSAAGAIFGLFLMDQPISFTAMLGIISLIGIVVNNAIVLMDYINLERQQGMSIDESAVRASIVRFRPIILTTVTTVIGLLPLMFSNSELFKPMAVTLVFGLLVSTFLTLVFIPLTYSLVFHYEDKAHV
jgi:multidrug efflux pump